MGEVGEVVGRLVMLKPPGRVIPGRWRSIHCPGFQVRGGSDDGDGVVDEGERWRWKSRVSGFTRVILSRWRVWRDWSG